MRSTIKWIKERGDKVRYQFDRDIMRWFDNLFEKNVSSFLVENFMCNIYDNSKLIKISDNSKSNNGTNLIPLELDCSVEDRVISLSKKESNLWTVSFLLSSKYVSLLKENVHPYFGHYIFENVSVYNNDEVYSFINNQIIEILEFVIDYRYDIDEDNYYIDYSDEFINLCSIIEINNRVMITESIYMYFVSEKELNFVDSCNRFNLNLRFDKKLGVGLMDSIIDLTESILLSTW